MSNLYLSLRALWWSFLPCSSIQAFKIKQTLPDWYLSYQSNLSFLNDPRLVWCIVILLDFSIKQLIWASSWKNLFIPYANNKGADQPAHPRSLIRTFVVRCLDSIISSFHIQNFKPLASFCGCTGLFESYMVENPEDKFSHDEAHIRHVFMSGARQLAGLSASRIAHKVENCNGV